MDKRVVWVIVAVAGIVIISCCCLVVMSGGISALFLSANASNQPGGLTETLQVEERLPVEPPNTIPNEDSDLPDLSENGLTDELVFQMDQIQAEVESFRDLPFKPEIDRKLLSGEELRQRVLEDFFDDFDEQEIFLDLVELEVLGLLNREFDLYDLYIELYSEQIAGFYDDETKEMVVVQGEMFGGPERMTYAHEYTHALQDAAFGLDEGLGLNEKNCEINGEYCAAVTALVEGDATLTELIWFQEFATDQDQQDVFDFYDGYESPVFDAAPVFLQEDFVFPYNQGFEFVEYLFEQGGFSAINNAYQNPPISTEQILHPERYPKEKPMLLNLPDFSTVFDDSWQDLGASTLGEWGWYLLLAKPDQLDWALKEETAKRAAAGWGGDIYTVYYQGDRDEIVLINHSVWDSKKEQTEFWDGLTAYGEQRWGQPHEDRTNQKIWLLEDQVVLIEKSNIGVVWLIAPDMDLLELINAEF